MSYTVDNREGLRIPGFYNEHSCFCGICALFFDVGLCVGNFDNNSFLAYIFLLIQYFTMLICMNKKPQANIRQFHSCTHTLLFSCVKYIDAYSDTYHLHLYLNQISFSTDSFSSLMPKSYSPEKKMFSQFSLAISQACRILLVSSKWIF